MSRARYVAKAIPKLGWQVWDRKLRRSWGKPFKEYPAQLLVELNRDRTSPAVIELSKPSRNPKPPTRK